MSGKEVTLMSGNERNRQWRLKIELTPITHKFSGYFILENGIDTHKRNMRHNDRVWVKRNLTCYCGVFEIHHNWNNAGRMQLLTRHQHQIVDAGRSGEHPAMEKKK